jgi:iron complex transport system ATP-binding protein
MIAHLQATGLTCTIGRRQILTGVDLAVKHGETIAVVGPNGSGKSTLLRVLAGTRPPAAGRLTLGGVDLGEMAARRRARAIALVGQEDELPADLLVGEFVALGRTPHRMPWAGGDAAELDIVLGALARVELADAIARPVDQLSGGERRRVVLARALAQDANLLILDEPTNHLDIRQQLALLDLVRGLGRTVVMALHDLNLAAASCDRIAVLHDGRVLPAADPATALAPGIVRRVFGVDTTAVTHPVTGRLHLLFAPATRRNDDPPISTHAGDGLGRRAAVDRMRS